MKKNYLFFLAMMLFVISSFAQETKKENPPKTKEERRMAKLLKSAVYPVIKSETMSGVIPVNDVTETPDPNMKYKLLFNVTIGSKDSAKVKKANPGLTEVGRVINLHIASGIPKENLEVVVVVHGFALFSIANNDAYRSNFKTDNPNLILIKELEDAGVKFIACGQAMAFLEFKKQDLLPIVKVSLTAQTALSNYQLKGFIKFDESTED